VTASVAAYRAFQHVYFDPGGAVIARDKQIAFANLCWAFYTNSVWEDLSTFSSYRANSRVYRDIRSIYNPVRRLVDFYAGQVYPGVLSEDGNRLPAGVQIAIPLAEDTPPALRSAIAQTWWWSNWQSGKAVMLRYGAATGSVLVEVVDDMDRGKVTYNVVWPTQVTALTLDAAGNVKAYTVEYQVNDESGKPYQYRKEVDGTSWRFFKDDKPYDYGQGAEYANPYGFVPAAWVKHRDLGGDWGAPAIHGSLQKINELNSLAAHIHDDIHKKIAAPKIFFGDGRISNAFGDTTKRGATDEFSPENGEREGLFYLKGPAGGSIGDLAGGLELDKAIPYLQQLIGEIEQDYPELALYRELRSMSQITGPAASRLMGDAAAMVYEAQANYDTASTKLFQMAVAIGGWRLTTGAWPNPTRQQQKFVGFDLESYARGDLDFAIMPRPLIAMTPVEQIEAERARLALDQDRAAGSVAADLEARLLAGEPAE